MEALVAAQWEAAATVTVVAADWTGVTGGAKAVAATAGCDACRSPRNRYRAHNQRM